MQHAGSTLRIVAPDGVWERSGECNRCGECCAGDFDLDGVERTVLGMCPLYRIADDGKGWCSNREHPLYLVGCNTFPSHPSQISDKPSCGYFFRKIN